MEVRSAKFSSKVLLKFSILDAPVSVAMFPQIEYETPYSTIQKRAASQTRRAVNLPLPPSG